MNTWESIGLARLFKHVAEPTDKTTMMIDVNGEELEIASGATIADLLVQLGFANRQVAVERNKHVVPRALHTDTALAAGDRLEVVSFVGGG